MDLSIIAAPLIGAVIGYTTNWIAIKMLFKPHEAKYIGKMRVPFTPGVIPRERDRIARSLGDAVGTNLLTEEVIINKLQNEEVIGQIKDYASEKLLSSPFSLDALIVKLLGHEEANSIYDKLTKVIGSEIKAQYGFIDAFLANNLPYSSSLSEILTEKGMNALDGIIMQNQQLLCESLINYLEQDTTAERLKELINELLAQKLGGLAAMFLQGETVYNMIMDYAKQKLSESEAQKAVAGIVVDLSHQLYHRSIQELLPPEVYINAISSMSSFIREKLDEMLDLDKGHIQAILQSLFRKEISLDSSYKTTIDLIVETLYKQFAKDHLPQFLKGFNVSEIVEGQINRFTTQEVEQLIFKIIDKELKAITWFGGLLGLLMGLLTLIF